MEELMEEPPTAYGQEEPHPGNPVKMKLRLLLAIMLVLLTGISAAAYWLYAKPNGKVETESKAAAAEEKLPADVVTASDSELKQITVEPVVERAIDIEQETTGKVAFNEDRQTPVFTPYAGRVIEVLANKGALVKQGQPLLVIESPDLVVAANDLSAARADQERAKIALDAAQKIADRSRTLFEKEAVAAKDLQQAEFDLARSKEELRRAQAAVAVAESKLSLFGKSQREIEHLEIQPASNIDRRVVIRAPINGTVVDRKVGAGQYIKSDMPDPLYLISDLSTLWVMADVYESLLPNIHIGSPVEINVASLPGRSFPARVSFINPTVDAATRTVRVRCVVPNAGSTLKPDMFAKIRIGSTVKQSKPVVPTGAVISQNNTTFLFVEEGHGRFRRREVKVGSEIKGMTVIEDGVKPDERVVTHGVLLLNGIVGKPPESKNE